MRVLYCLVGGEKDYTPISDTQEAKLTKHIRDKTIPPSFALGGKKIVSDTIIGFSDNPEPPRQSSNLNFDKFRTMVHQSDWYQRSKALREVEAPR